MSTSICYVHDWIVQIAGAERVLIELLKFRPADLFTLFCSEKAVNELKRRTYTNLSINTSFLQKLPGIQKVYKSLLPAFPVAIESLNVSKYNIIFSLSHAIAKGVRKSNDQIHICYCHTPMRYIWHLYQNYYEYGNILQKLGLRAFKKYLQTWDKKTSKNVDVFLVPSTAVRERVRKIYGRDSFVVPPPVDTELFSPSYEKEDYFLFVGRLDIPYKKVDIVVNAFNLLNEKLIVVGDGKDLEKLKRIAKSNIEFVGWKSGKQLVEYMARARALIIPSEEDFGLVAVESQACGTPVIAYGKGGCIDTVKDGKTGILFYEQTVDSLVAAVRRFIILEDQFKLEEIRKNSLKFSRENFRQKINNILCNVTK